MIKKLLFLFVLSLSLQCYSQAVANPAPTLESCDGTFVLTSQNAIILGTQSPNDFEVRYHHSMTDATNVLNEIVNPNNYFGIDGEIIYASVYSTADQSVAVTSFALQDISPVVAQFPDVNVCDSYILPALQPGQMYFTGPDGTGTPLSAGDVITTTMTVYIFAQNGSCQNESSFIVIVTGTPSTPQVSDVAACDTYVLPQLPGWYTYFSGPNGTGTQILTGDIITTTQTIYVLGQAGMCSSEASFTVTIFNTPITSQLPDVITCGPYTLPALPVGQSYFSIPGGAPLTDLVITESMTIYILAESGTIPNCTDESSFTVEITDMTPIQLAPLVACDENGDGVTGFDLTSVAAGISFNGQGTGVSFYETETDADTGLPGNALSSPYFPMFNNQTIYVRISNGTGGSGCFVISPLTLVASDCTNNTISGTVTLDADSNGCSTADSAMSNVSVACANGTSTVYAYTNAEGQFEFTNVLSGNNIISVGMPAGYISTPASATVTLTGTGQSGSTNFCVVPPPPYNDAMVQIVPVTAAVPGFASQYALLVGNQGTTTLSGSVTMDYDDEFLTYNGSIPTASVAGNVLTFTFNDLAPSQVTNFQVFFTVSTPPTAESGDVLVFIANVTTNEADANSSNNNIVYQQTVVNSYDPNDITVHEGLYVSPNEALDYLHYTIRFQNTGTASATYVRLENELDPLLDWSTFQPIAASHEYLTERNGNDVTFRFNDIMLPGSSFDEPGSHGFVTYRIKPTAAFAEPEDIISSVADIFFDFNAPITTNTATTQINFLSTDEYDRNGFVIYPNPATYGFNIRFDDASLVDISIVDLQGKVVLSIPQQVSNNAASVDISGIASGMYFVRIVDGERVEVRKLVVR